MTSPRDLLSPVSHVPVLNLRTPRHQKAIQEANQASASMLSLQHGVPYIDSAMACIMNEEIHRAKDYPDTALFSVFPEVGLGKAPTTRSISPTRDVHGLLLDLRHDAAAFQAPETDA